MRDFYFDHQKLQALAERHREEFAAANPFPHVVLDDFLPQDVLSGVISEFPKPDHAAWQMHGPGPTTNTQNRQIEKLVVSDEANFPSGIRHLMLQFNSATFLKFLESLTGIRGLIPDPSFNGCGLHSTGAGGKLMVHVDSERHPLGKPLHQRLNAIFYINDEWKDDYGGHLELWDYNTRRCVKKVLPIANRLVVFDTGTRSLHGHPHPLSCPQDRRRNSLAAYYYVVERPFGDEYDRYNMHVGWVPTTEQDFRFARAQAIRSAIKKFVPPICIDILRLLKPRRN